MTLSAMELTDFNFYIVKSDIIRNITDMDDFNSLVDYMFDVTKLDEFDYSKPLIINIIKTIPNIISSFDNAIHTRFVSMIGDSVKLSTCLEVYYKLNKICDILRKYVYYTTHIRQIITNAYITFNNVVFSRLIADTTYLDKIIIDKNIELFCEYMNLLYDMRFINNNIYHTISLVKSKLIDVSIVNSLMVYLDTFIRNKQFINSVKLIESCGMLLQQEIYFKLYIKYFQLRLFDKLTDLTFEKRILNNFKKYIRLDRYKCMCNMIESMYKSNNINHNLLKCTIKTSDTTPNDFNIKKLHCKIINDNDWDISDQNIINVKLHPSIAIYTEVVDKYLKIIDDGAINVEWIHTMGWVLLNIRTKIKNIKVELNPIQASILLYLSAETTTHYKIIAKHLQINSYICQTFLRSLESLQLIKSIKYDYIINREYYGPDYINADKAAKALISVLG